MLARILQFLSSLSVCIRTKGLTARVSSRPEAKAVLRRPRLAGTRQYISCTCLGCKKVTLVAFTYKYPWRVPHRQLRLTKTRDVTHNYSVDLIPSANNLFYTTHKLVAPLPALLTTIPHDRSAINKIMSYDTLHNLSVC